MWGRTAFGPGLPRDPCLGG